MITYEIDSTARLVTCSVNVHLRVLDIAEVVGHLFADRAFDVGFNTLVIVAGETVIPDLPARNALAQLLQTWRKLHVPAKWALILPTSVWLRLANHLIEEYKLDSRNVRCFPDCPSALAWFYEPALPIVTAQS